MHNDSNVQIKTSERFIPILLAGAHKSVCFLSIQIESISKIQNETFCIFIFEEKISDADKKILTAQVSSKDNIHLQFINTEEYTEQLEFPYRAKGTYNFARLLAPGLLPMVSKAIFISDNVIPNANIVKQYNDFDAENDFVVDFNNNPSDGTDALSNTTNITQPSSGCVLHAGRPPLTDDIFCNALHRLYCNSGIFVYSLMELRKEPYQIASQEFYKYCRALQKQIKSYTNKKAVIEISGTPYFDILAYWEEIPLPNTPEYWMNARNSPYYESLLLQFLGVPKAAQMKPKKPKEIAPLPTPSAPQPLQDEPRSERGGKIRTTGWPITMDQRITDVGPIRKALAAFLLKSTAGPSTNSANGFENRFKASSKLRQMAILLLVDWDRLKVNICIKQFNAISIKTGLGVFIAPSKK